MLAAVPLLAMLLAATGCAVAPPRPVYSPQGRAPLAVAPAPMYFYPEQGQPESLQDRDRYECYRWASAQTGTDPGMTPLRLPATPPPLAPVRDGADVVAGAATGAVLGAALSSPRHAGDHAAAGAVIGLLLGAIAQESRAQAVERAQERRDVHYAQARAAAMVPMDNFRRAMSACMQGRGYRPA